MRQTVGALSAPLGDQAIFARLLPPAALALLGFGENPGNPQRQWWSKDKRVLTRKYVGTVTGGSIVIARDGTELLIRGLLGKEVVFRCAIRDRFQDGRGRRGKNSPLNPFPVTHELANALPHPKFRSAELTVYSYDLSDRPIDPRLKDFICNPDKFMFPWSQFKPDVFFPLWESAYASGLAPWQVHHPLHGFAPHFIGAACELLQELGYHRAEVVPGWYNAVVFFEKRLGFRYLHAEHEAAAQLLHERVDELSVRLSAGAGGKPLTAWQKSWIVALQNVPSAYLQGKYQRFYLGGMHWINSPTNTDYCARLYRDLNTFEASDIP
jgi:hypothetical protein